MNSISYNIDKSIINLFTSDNLSNILTNLNIDKYYESKQIHSNIVNIVDNNYQNNTIGDALITNIPNKPLIIKTADCIPIVLYDHKNKVIASIHSGWLGTLNNITKDTINIMKDKFNSKINNLSAYIYPSIRRCHFEVDTDVYLKFKEKISNIDKYTNKLGIKYHIDLQQIVKDNLLELGITNITDNSICTYCQHDSFYSYRYNKTDKRNILLVMIKE